MSTDWYFYAELRDGDCWTVPRGFLSSDLPRRVEEFSWMDQCVKAAWAFFSEDALYPFVQGYPPGNSQLYSYLCPLFGDSVIRREKNPHFVSYENLEVDLWGVSRSLLLQDRVPAKFALLFGNGTGDFPEAELSAAGATDAHLHELWQGARPATEPIDRLHGSGHYKLGHVREDYLVDVTWYSSVEWWLGGVAKDFADLRSLGRDAEIRVIALLG